MFERRDNGDWLVNIQYNALSSLGLNESINSISVEYFSLQALEEKSFFVTAVCTTNSDNGKNIFSTGRPPECLKEKPGGQARRRQFLHDLLATSANSGWWWDGESTEELQSFSHRLVSSLGEKFSVRT